VLIVVERSAARLSSGAGRQPLRQFDERIGLCRSFAEANNDAKRRDVVGQQGESMKLLDSFRERTQ
jgi:hypothetical protein